MILRTRSSAPAGQRTRRQLLLCGIAAAVFAAGCGGSSAPEQPPATGTPAPATAEPDSGLRVYVTDETGRDVVALDPVSGRIVSRIEVGKRPRGVKVSKDGTRLLIALSGSPIGGPGVDESKLPPADRAADGIGVVDLSSRTLERKLTSGQDPESFDLSPDSRFVYVSNEDAAQLSVVDFDSGEVVQRVRVGEEPEGVTVRPDGAFVYVTCEEDNEVVVVDTRTYEVVARLNTGPRPRSVVFTADGATAFVSNENGASVSVVDGQAHKVVDTIKLPQIEGAPTAPRPMGTAMSADGSRVYVSLGRAKAVAVIDVARRALVSTITDVGDRPWGIGVSPDGTKVFTANGPSGDVSVIDVASGTVERRIAVGGSPWGIAVADVR